MIGRDMAGCLPFLAVTAASLLSAFILPSLHGRGQWLWFGASLLTGIMGICLLAYARLPLYRQGKFLSIGPRQLPGDRLPAYRWAWRLIMTTLLVQALLVVITR